MTHETPAQDAYSPSTAKGLRKVAGAPLRWHTAILEELEALWTSGTETQAIQEILHIDHDFVVSVMAIKSKCSDMGYRRPQTLENKPRGFDDTPIRNFVRQSNGPSGPVRKYPVPKGGFSMIGRGL